MDDLVSEQSKLIISSTFIPAPMDGNIVKGACVVDQEIPQHGEGNQHWNHWEIVSRCKGNFELRVGRGLSRRKIQAKSVCKSYTYMASSNVSLIGKFHITSGSTDENQACWVQIVTELSGQYYFVTKFERRSHSRTQYFRINWIYSLAEHFGHKQIPVAVTEPSLSWTYNNKEWRTSITRACIGPNNKEGGK